ncbi:hypothetical protein HPB47_023776 [Ixodes persulcatus]|uniref:Uncharacterized protein n=1 Tax=Ixodes persulcatus TaxID=34615 RepID=A0AC60Q8D1_IXOPE|nr:hypothetical protein HPB47_023776 [Ixodes persulcatus]
MGLELKVDLLGVIQMISGAWANVKQDIMANCFRRADFVIATEEGFAQVPDNDGSESLSDAFRQLSTFPGVMPVEVTARDLVSIDNEVQAEAELSKADIMADVAGAEEAKSSGNEDPGEQEASLVPTLQAAQIIDSDKRQGVSPPSRNFNFIADAVEKTAPAVVFIEILGRHPFTQQQITVSNGSGFIVKSDGLILTNAHVVADGRLVTVKLQNGQEYKGKVESVDLRSDLATVRIVALLRCYYELHTHVHSSPHMIAPSLGAEEDPSSATSERWYLGITMLTLTPSLIQELQERDPMFPNVSSGVLVWRVVLGSPANLAGLQPGDVITRIGGKEARSSQDIYRALEAWKPVEIEVIHRGSKKTVTAQP